ncbi:MAG: hypothetical protein ACREVL_10455 [Solimonas sp.]
MRSFHLSFLLPSLLATTLLGACGGGGANDNGSGGTPREFTIQQEALTESSGLGTSGRSADLYWSHNDSGGPTDLYAFDGKGAPRGALHLQPAVNLDWEDMAAFTENDTPRLLVGDIGDNGAIRLSVRLYIIDEPALDGSNATQTVTPQQTIIVHYPDGARDCESVAVDPVEGMIYLLSKRDAVPRLYRLPLHPTLPLLVAAEALGEINIPRAAADDPDPERSNWVTSMEFDSTLRRAAVVTLTHAYVYTRADNETWQQAFQHAPRALDLPGYSQIEAISFSADGKELLITSEGSPTPAAHLPL